MGLLRKQSKPKRIGRIAYEKEINNIYYILYCLKSLNQYAKGKFNKVNWKYILLFL